MMELLLTGTDLNACTPCGRTALHVAASQGHGNIVDILLEKGNSELSQIN